MAKEQQKEVKLSLIFSAIFTVGIIILTILTEIITK